MSERDNESFDLDEEFLTGATEDGTDYDRLLDRVDKRVRNQGKRGKAAWSRLEEVLADKKLEKDLQGLRRRALEPPHVSSSSQRLNDCAARRAGRARSAL